MTARLAALIAAAAVSFATGPVDARNDPVVLRMAAISPDGTPWARELRALARDVEAQTNGDVRIKWYLGAIAGDESTALARMRHGQLDGLAGASFCSELAPSLRVIEVVGLFRNRGEVTAALAALRPILESEFRRSGVVDLSNTVFGFDILFSRRPIRSMAELRNTRWWIWSGSHVYQETFARLGVRTQPSSTEQAAIDYENGKNDGFVALPSAALAFQWSTAVGYFVPLNVAMLPGCLVLANSAMDPLTIEQQRIVRAAAAKFTLRWNDTTATLDQALIGGLFEKQGLKRVAVSPRLDVEFREAARQTRDALGDKLVPHELLNRVLSLLADYRLDHPQ